MSAMNAAEHPELWSFLELLKPGQVLAGTVAAIRPFGVFVALDEGPRHPVYPGVGFIGIPELSWVRFEEASEIIEVGQRIECEFLQFDTWNGEARLSLRAMQPDPFPLFADGVTAGQVIDGKATKLVPFGVFVEVAEGIEGLVHLREFAGEPVESPEGRVQVGDRMKVVVTEADRVRRTVSLSQRQVPADLR
ncbi:S1 RNA-binding domain-containing protein [Streptomyces sp. NPDC048357]|uniref:S1 RNA-binding domain-containing protein n=1 Tax=Streptomyces sp. NPDC048357 TaxID=3154719 RepID=UPI00341FE065